MCVSLNVKTKKSFQKKFFLNFYQTKTKELATQCVGWDKRVVERRVK